jgi:hypothetical protein
MVEINKHRQKPRVFFYSRYDGDSLFGTHLQLAHEVLDSLFYLTDSSSADFSISLDYSSANLQTIEDVGIPADRRYLIVREPKQVHPYPHSSKASRDFGQIYVLGTYDSVNKKTRSWPYTRDFHGAVADFAEATSPNRQERVVAIASWRASFIVDGLYSLRARAFSMLDIDTFGRDWEASIGKKLKELVAQVVIVLGNEFGILTDLLPQLILKPRNYRGALESKFETLAQYKASLVIENSQDYMSEKVLDSLSSATIPIYCGADLSKFGIPENLYVRCEANVESITAATNLAMKMDYLAWRQDLLTWLRSPKGIELLDERIQWTNLFEEIRKNMIMKVGSES